jgi:hypothetical protein
MRGRDQPGWRGISCSNLGCWSGNGRLTTALTGGATRRTVMPWSPTPARRPGGYGKLFSRRSSPTGLARGGDSPRVVLGWRRWPEGSVWWWPTCSDLQRWRGGLSGGSPAWPRQWAASPRCPLAPPGDGLARAAAKIAHEEKFLVARVWALRTKFNRFRPLFIEILIPNRRRQGS